MYLKDVFPTSRLLGYFEFYYRAYGSDVDFDRDRKVNLDDRARVRTKNAAQMISLLAADWGVSPTVWQKAQLPREFHGKISVIHEGIDFLGRRGQSQQIEGGASYQVFPGGGDRGTQTPLLEFRQNKHIDPIRRPIGVFHCGGCSVSRGLKRPIPARFLIVDGFWVAANRALSGVRGPVGGSPSRSKVARRTRSSLLPAAEGLKPLSSSLARTNTSSTFVGQSASFTAGGVAFRGG